MLNVVICIVCLHFSSFCSLSSVADFSNPGARAPTSAGRVPFFTRAKSDVVYICGLSVSHGYLSIAVFLFSSIEANLIDEQQTILTIEPQDSYAQDQVRHCIRLSEDLFACLYVHHAASHGICFKKSYLLFRWVLT